MVVGARKGGFEKLGDRSNEEVSGREFERVRDANSIRKAP